MAFHLLPAWRAAMSRPDAMLLDLGARGERLLARVRMACAMVFMTWPLAAALGGAPSLHVAIAFGLVFLYLIGSLYLVVRTQRSGRLHRLPLASTAFDVGMAVACIAALVARDAAAGLNSTAAWGGLAAAVGATALRADARSSVFAGALGMAAVPCLVGLAWALHGVAGFESLDYGHVDMRELTLRTVLLGLLAACIAAAAHRARTLVEVSGTDTLTGLPNRTWLLQRMPQLLDTVVADGGVLTVALVDLDHVRRFNHDHGHQAGDRALLALAAALRAFVPGGDSLVRLAGGEFLVLMRLPVGTTWERVDALRRLFAERPVDGAGGPPLHATFSAGLASFPHDGRDLSHLLRRADDRLQIARAEGRNKVIARS